MLFRVVFFFLLLLAEEAIAKDLSSSIYSRYTNNTEEPPRSCIFEKVTVSNTQEAQAISHCEMIRGNIEVTEFEDSILRLDRISKIEGSLIIRNSENLMRVDAYSLRVITDTFHMERLQLLGLIEMPNLASVYRLEWQVLPLLSQASIGSLKDVRSVTVSDTSLEMISKFAGSELQDLNINNNRFMELVDFDAETVSNLLHITGNAPNMRVKLGQLRLARNISVSNVRELNMTRLRKVDGSMSMVENTLTDISFPSLSEIGGLFRMAENHEANGANFDAVLDIGGGVLIANNSALSKINFLPKLQAIGGALEMIGDIADTEWQSLKMVKGSISLRSSDSNFDCNKWISGPIKNTLRGGEIACFLQSPDGSTTSASSGATGVDQVSQGAKHFSRWILATFVFAVCLSA
ncbi:hypothetical protein METBIDRAFT_80118 [Metschnikowia bicuspidata var. bicuspidata NRRL YB-4993]|uniref:Receptor L-domain domain-containing protein n=1 Tax=Metschnikowia bicuspidata var. bicuspidata NRRL YB-4993 TaxID=869754 RepID=A0A1A0H1X4_9ASCO|nr:hypothetical protein METBIDRAFT_80118 [Metschnikowia bicuspidata var. bicuspidata NRRL YB-4993]OBA18031.1 hypothetical protein METBIDRAFT_80118 [Metschnikowia bicuspidata var. bicuspidata NRRL YB-4993]